MSTDPWLVFDYEVNMLEATCALLESGDPRFAKFTQELKNAVVESAVLHSRILADILLSRTDPKRYPDDIRLTDLLPEFESSSIARFEVAYGKPAEIGSPCWAFNKMLAHPTTSRTDSYNYTSHLNAVVPLIRQLVADIRSSKRAMR